MEDRAQARAHPHRVTSDGDGSSKGTGRMQGWVMGQGGQGKLLPSKEGTEPVPEQRDRKGNRVGIWGEGATSAKAR